MPTHHLRRKGDMEYVFTELTEDCTVLDIFRHSWLCNMYTQLGYSESVLGLSGHVRYPGTLQYIYIHSLEYPKSVLGLSGHIGYPGYFRQL